MAWKGFIVESKRFMNYPDCWSEWDTQPYKVDDWTMKDKYKAKLKFWLKFPRALFRYSWFSYLDRIRRR